MNFDKTVEDLAQYSQLHLRLTDPTTNQNFAYYAAQRKRTIPADPESPVANTDGQKRIRDTKNVYEVGDVPEEDQQSALDFLQYIQNAGAKVDAIDVYKQSALFFASRDGNTKCVIHLLQHGCKAQKRDQHNQCAHFYAARQNRLETMRVLLKNKAEPNLRDNSGDTALFYAAKNGHLEMARILVEGGCDPGIRNKLKQNAAQVARTAGKMDMVKYLEKFKPEKHTRSSFSVPILHPPPKKRIRLMIRHPVTNKLMDLNEACMKDFEPKVHDAAESSKAKKQENQQRKRIDKKKWHDAAHNFLQGVFMHTESWPFCTPVIPEAHGCPDYKEHVQMPMDFSTIRKKLKTGAYTNLRSFVGDVDLVFNNVRHYNNSSSDVWLMANALMQYCAQQFKVHGLEQTYKAEAEQVWAEMRAMPVEKLAAMAKNKFNEFKERVLFHFYVFINNLLNSIFNKFSLNPHILQNCC
jgi:hypothetical protein